MAIDFITDQLAVGGRDDALSAESLAAAQIDFVLSLVLDMSVPDIRQARLEVADREPLPALTMTRAVELIASEIDAGRRVLVHCHMGISRSPAIALCYLRERQGLSMAQSLATLKRARPVAIPHPALLASISAHYDHQPTDFRPPSLRRSFLLEGGPA